MSYVLLLRGIQGSGKTEYAKKWLRENPERRVRVNRDDLRSMLFNKASLTPDEEKTVTNVELSIIESALAQNKDILIDNMNMSPKYTTAYQRLAYKYNATVINKDFWIDLGDAIERVSKRTEHPVPEERIRKAFKRYTENGKLLPLQPYIVDYTYQPDTTKPQAIILDVDGTAMHIHPTRTPFEYNKVIDDIPNTPIIETVKALQNQNYLTIVVSGREDSCLEDTKLSLEIAGINIHQIHMRPTGDGRPDTTIKREIFDNHIRNNYNILLALDDRTTVVNMWRELGITTYQVAEFNG